MQKNKPGLNLKSPALRRIVPIFILLIFSATIVCSQELPDSIVKQRVFFLQKSLKSDQRGTKQWWYSWFAGYGVATIGQAVIYSSSDDKTTRQDMAVGAVTTLTGFFGQFVSPFQPVSFTEKLDQLPAGNPAERQDKMSQMEIFLADRAAMEIKARRWKAHLLPTAVNLASGMITWLAFDRTVWDGVANFALNCVVTEAQIWSQPIRARKELKHYNTQFGSQNIVMHLSREIKWNLIVSLKGAGVRMVF